MLKSKANISLCFPYILWCALLLHKIYYYIILKNEVLTHFFLVGLTQVPKITYWLAFKAWDIVSYNQNINAQIDSRTESFGNSTYHVMLRRIFCIYRRQTMYFQLVLERQRGKIGLRPTTRWSQVPQVSIHPSIKWRTLIS